MFGLELTGEQEVRVPQHAALAARHGAAVADATWHEAGALTGLHPMLRLPLAELAFPALRDRPRPEQDTVLASVQTLIEADGRLSVSEYCLSRLMHAELYEAIHHTPAWGRRRYSLSASRGAAGLLLATLAHAGHGEPAAAEAAFHAGVAVLLSGQRLRHAPLAEGVLALEQYGRRWTDSTRRQGAAGAGDGDGDRSRRKDDRRRAGAAAHDLRHAALPALAAGRALLDGHAGVGGSPRWGRRRCRFRHPGGLTRPGRPAPGARAAGLGGASPPAQPPAGTPPQASVPDMATTTGPSSGSTTFDSA
ncbi:MAG: hypothetical protein ACRDWI_09445 [Jiangellaceae bacterium]